MRTSKSPYARQSSATATSGQVSKQPAQPELISINQQPAKLSATSSVDKTGTTSIATIEPLPMPLICISDSLDAHVTQNIREKIGLRSLLIWQNYSPLNLTSIRHKI